MRRFLLLLVLVTAVACRNTPFPTPAASPTAPPEILRLGLTDSAAVLADLVSEPYAQQTERAVLQFVTGNNQALFADLESGALDAIFVHHIPETNERYFNPTALDGLVILVHPDNPVAGLNTAELQAIFSGQLTNWTAVGSLDQPITVLSRERGAGVRTLLVQRILAEQRLSLNAAIQAGNGAMTTAVANDPTAIGTGMMGSATNVRLLPIDGVPATTATTASQQYPLTVPLYFVAATEAEPEGELRAFLAWLQSEAGQDILGGRYGRVR